MTARAFAVGDQVKLTDRYAKTLTRDQRAHSLVNWCNRRGVVVACTAYIVRVRWEGRKSKDCLPIAAVEKMQ